MSDHTIGFRVLGGPRSRRLPTQWWRAWDGYRTLDPLAKVDEEAYLSAFTFTGDYRRHFTANGMSPRGFAGSCDAPWIWFDIDRDGDQQEAHRVTKTLAACIADRYGLPKDWLLVFFSGGKGYHVGVPAQVIDDFQPSPLVPSICRRFAELVADAAGVEIDSSIYDAVRIFRAPNSRHAKTGLYKRWLSFHQLMRLSAEEVIERARRPASFEVQVPAFACSLLTDQWVEAARLVESATANRNNGKASLNKLTLAFIRDGADPGDRHRHLYSAARNLGDCGCPERLAFELLADSALNSDLPNNDVTRTIQCGLRDSNRNTH